MSFLYGLSFGCSSKCVGVYFTTNCFGTLLWTFFSSFPSQAVECFLQVLVLSTFFQWALSFFPYVGKICMFVAISDPIFIVFFAKDFLPGLSFGCLTNLSTQFYRYHGLLCYLVLIFV